MKVEQDENTTLYSLDQHESPDFVRTDHMITAVRVTSTGGDDRVVIYNRGANAGHLFLRKGDGAAFAKKLLEG
jgi:hypothetical protein